VAEGLRGLAIRDAVAGVELARMTGHPSNVVGVAASPDERTFASVCDHDTLKLWDSRAGQPVLDYTGFGGRPALLRFNRSGSELFVLVNRGRPPSSARGSPTLKRA
jgi:WD40 repeat protein